jgi:hypothetical protein
LFAAAQKPKHRVPNRASTQALAKVPSRLPPVPSTAPSAPRPRKSSSSSLEREAAEAMIGEVGEGEPALAEDLRVEASKV